MLFSQKLYYFQEWIYNILVVKTHRTLCKNVIIKDSTTYAGLIQALTYLCMYAFEMSSITSTCVMSLT